MVVGRVGDVVIQHGRRLVPLGERLRAGGVHVRRDLAVVERSCVVLEDYWKNSGQIWLQSGSECHLNGPIRDLFRSNFAEPKCTEI